MTHQVIEPNLDGSDLSIGIVYSRFNEEVVTPLKEACLVELTRLKVASEEVTLVSVPGALELPLVLGQLARTHQFDALIALGAVVRGDTYHFEVVSNESARGICQVMLEEETPIANGVLTVDNEEQAMQRVVQKGEDCARAAVEMANLAYLIDDSYEDGLDDMEVPF